MCTNKGHGQICAEIETYTHCNMDTEFGNGKKWLWYDQKTIILTVIVAQRAES